MSSIELILCGGTEKCRRVERRKKKKKKECRFFRNFIISIECDAVSFWQRRLRANVVTQLGAPGPVRSGPCSSAVTHKPKFTTLSNEARRS